MLTGIKFCVLVVCVMFPSSLARMPQCMKCAPGKFKSSDIFVPCTPCPENTFSAVPGAVQCLPCPPLSSSANGSSRCTFEACRLDEYNFGCVCPVGYTGPDGGPCTPCSAGTYKNWLGTGECSNCTGGRTSHEGSVTCFCPSGTSLVSGRCVPIYHESVRLTGVLEMDTNSTNSSSETNAPMLKQQLKTSTADLYNISESLVEVFLSSSESGRINVEIYLLAVDAQSFAAIANATSVVTPPMLQNVERSTVFVSMNEGSFKSCSKNEVSTSDECICTAGYTRAAGKCVACAPGKVKAAAGDGACDACTNNTFSRTAALNCSTCPPTATTKQNHTSCACNPGFVFFNDTCTATEALYMSVSGTLELPDGAFTASELQSILVDGLSKFLNFSKEFITITVTIRTNNTNASAATPRNASNATETLQTNNTSNATVTLQMNNTSNATFSGRRLLFASTVEYIFTAVFQIGLNDKPTYTKVEKFVRDAREKRRVITDANGYRFIIQKADLVPGYISDGGVAVGKCENGRYQTTDSITKTLVCKEIEENLQGYWLILVSALFGGAGCVLLQYCTRGGTGVVDKIHAAGQSLVSSYKNAKIAPLLFPATVTFEYQLLPGQSI